MLFLGVELLLRAFQNPTLQYYRDVKLLHVYHPSYHVGLAPHVDFNIRHYRGLWKARFTTNSLGYRGSPEPGPGIRQLACLGDSIVMGFGVSDRDTFCARLNGIRLGGREYQAQNMGVDAFGSMGSALRLEEGARLLPDLKIALFFISPNDYTMPPELRRLGELSDDEKDVLREKDPSFRFWFRLQFEITRWSYALQALKLSWEQLHIRLIGMGPSLQAELYRAGLISDPEIIAGLRQAGLISKRDDESERNPIVYTIRSFYRLSQPSDCGETRPRDERPDDMKPVAPKKMCPTPVEENVICAGRPVAQAELEPLPEITRRAYRHMISVAKKHGIIIIPVLLPIQNEVLQCAQSGLHSRHFNYARRAARFFRKEGIPVLDLSPHIGEMCGEPISPVTGGRRVSQIGDYFIPGDGHFTVLGNRWAARALRGELRKRFSGQ